MLGLIWTIIVGFVVGALARLIMPGTDKAGFVMTSLLGIGGALIATYLGRAIGLYEAGQGAGFVGAIVGALILLFLFRKMKAA